MKWICPTCQERNGMVSGICGACANIRPEKVEAIETDDEKRVTAFASETRPTFFQRIFSLRQRLTRRDFAIVFASLQILQFAGVWLTVRKFDDVADIFAVILYMVVTVFVVIAAGKRCRDMDANPWWGLLSTMIVFGLVVLFFGTGTKGANKYGPDPRRT